jgi:hypothetical protein
VHHKIRHMNAVATGDAPVEVVDHVVLNISHGGLSRSHDTDLDEA